MTAAIARAEPIDYPAETRGLNFFDLDVNLRRLLWRRAPGLLERHEARLSDFGAWVGGPLDAQAAYSDRIAPPRLVSHDRHGNRSGRVICNPAYLECHREAYRRGVIGLCYGAEAAPHLLSFVMGYLLSSADISIHCPVTMAGALMVEEAAFDLKAGDGRKACIARRFTRMTFGPRAAIGPAPDPDHAEVERLLGYAVIDFT